jgi:Domain of unknown function (DUF4037)
MPTAMKGQQSGNSDKHDLTGLELARLFFHECVAPIVEAAAPGLRYSAGRIGDGSDVMGFDDAVSRDHGWGPRCVLLLAPEHAGELRRTLDAALAGNLPLTYRGYTTSFWRPTGSLIFRDAPPVAHWIEMATTEEFLRYHLGVAGVAGLSPRDWLAMSSFNLLAMTAGEMFRDDLGFEETRRALAFYPDDVRLYLIAAEWRKIAEEQAFPGRAGSRGDEAGSAIVAARLAERLMRICFHLERRYVPYGKWFGSAFLRLERCTEVRAPITRMLTAPTWQQRDHHWGEALAAVIAAHERDGLVEAGVYRPAPIHASRPGTGLPRFERGGPPPIGTLIDDIRARIADPDIRELARALATPANADKPPSRRCGVLARKDADSAPTADCSVGQRRP